MSNQLTVLNNSQAIQQGGLGIDFSSKLFAIKPASINIIQPNSQVEGKRGNIRITETGDSFAEMDCVFLAQPKEPRHLYGGKPGEMNHSLENLICSSLDGITPDPRAREKQAMYCNGCPQSDTTAWVAYHDKHGVWNKELAPPCQGSYYAVIMDTKYKMPLQMFVRGKSTKTFSKDFENLTRTFLMAQAQGKNPNIFDIRFKLTTEQITTGKFISYVYRMKNFNLVTPEEREAFGEVYLKFAAQAQARAAAPAPLPDYDDDLSAPATGRPEPEFEEGEIAL